MTEYISALSENNFEILEKIIQKKYRKFTAMYWMLKEYSNHVAALKYKDTDNDVLEIEVTLSGVNIDTVMENLQSSMPDDFSILIWNEKKKIHIEITKEEND
jgi:hypothetical protein